MSTETAATASFELFDDLDLPVVAEMRSREAHRAQLAAEIAEIKAAERADEHRRIKLIRTASIDPDFAGIVQRRILAVAASQDGQVSANDVRAWSQERFADVWDLVDRRFSAQWSALATRGLIAATGEEEPNLDFSGGNDNKSLPVWKMTPAGWSAFRSGSLTAPKVTKAAVRERLTAPVVPSVRAEIREARATADFDYKPWED